MVADGHSDFLRAIYSDVPSHLPFPAKEKGQRCSLTNRCRQRGMASPVPLRGSRWLVPRA